MTNKPLSTHWADITADKIIRERGTKDLLVCASGITPSGTVHIGNFREIISVELVVRALRERNRKVRFIYSWDDFDVFRKVPKDMPRQDYLSTFLQRPITEVPDVVGSESSYAAHNEKKLEKTLPLVGIEPEYIYQAEQYRASRYAEPMKIALDHRDSIRRQLNAHRHTPLPDDWWPLSVFCTKCGRDDTRVTGRQGDYGVCYECLQHNCGHTETVDLRSTGAVKLPWRIDWPMRWAYEGVDFEPAGKDHHSEGGSFDTAKLTAREVYAYDPPVTFQYDFVRIKGGTGKISSSEGNAASLADVLSVYQPEVLRYLFAGTRPNSEFAISFDTDVLKVYEDYDKLERNYFNKPDNPQKLKKWEKDARVYELSQIHTVPKSLSYQVSIRHLSSLLQIHSGDIDAVAASLGDVPTDQMARFRIRAQCAWNWVSIHAPEDFRFSLRNLDDGPTDGISPEIARAVADLGQLAKDKLGKLTEKEFSVLMYDIPKNHGLESADFFTAVYRALIGKDKGPRLLNFLHIIGPDTVSNLLTQYS